MGWIHRGVAFAALAWSASVLPGCGSASGIGSGTLSLSVADAPVDGAQQVVVQFHGLMLQGPNGTTTLTYCRDATGRLTVTSSTCAQPLPQQINLLALTGGLSAPLLDHYSLAAGHYAWIRLLIDATPGATDSYVTINGSRYGLEIPSGAATGLQLNRGFDVPTDGSPSFTVDFNLRASVHAPAAASTDYLLRPTLRVVDDAVVGTLTGVVTLNPATCTSPAVYVYAGQHATPVDIEGAAGDPVTTAPVILNTLTGLFEYRAAFLPAGMYTVALTCVSAVDNPDTAENLGFSGAADVSIVAGRTTQHDF